MESWILQDFLPKPRIKCNALMSFKSCFSQYFSNHINLMPYSPTKRKLNQKES